MQEYADPIAIVDPLVDWHFPFFRTKPGPHLGVVGPDEPPVELPVDEPPDFVPLLLEPDDEELDEPFEFVFCAAC